jgi:hypothetical protein
MKAEQEAIHNQMVRDLILRTMREYPLGLALYTLQACLRAARVKLEPDELELHVRYLESAGFIEPLKKRTPEFRIYQITADALDYLTQNQL